MKNEELKCPVGYDPVAWARLDRAGRERVCKWRSGEKELKCPEGYDPEAWANLNDADREVVVARSQGKLPESEEGGEVTVRVLLALLRTHPSDLDGIKLTIAQCADELESNVEDEERPRVNRMLVTAAAAGIPTELQVQTIAKHLGLKISPEMETTATRRDFHPRSQQGDGLRPLQPSARAEIAAQEQQQQ